MFNGRALNLYLVAVGFCISLELADLWERKLHTSFVGKIIKILQLVTWLKEKISACQQGKLVVIHIQHYYIINLVLSALWAVARSGSLGIVILNLVCVFKPCTVASWKNNQGFSRIICHVTCIKDAIHMINSLYLP